MILTVLAIAAVILLIATVGVSLWYLRADWRQEYGYRAIQKRIWKKQDEYRGPR